MRIARWKITRKRKDWVIWRNTVTGVEMWILTGQLHGSKVSEFNDWFVWKNSIGDAGTKGHFKTKQKALKFVVSYMRKNNL